MKKIVLPYREIKKGMAFTKAEEFCLQGQVSAVKKGPFAPEIRDERHKKSTMLVCELQFNHKI